ncbi:hypothetical protein LCGC14_2127360 [marine sediment metagenome]|uniref:Glycosyl transferase family 1 domain-containing protein n=1 Tax=marine sediment metagenome TaxID=412755 RepID=A0A0F9EPK7_9ZZZZ
MRKLAILDGANKGIVYVNHNPVDLDVFFPIKDISKDIDILFIGRLSVEKGVEILIKATLFFEKKWSVTIVGEGALRKDLEKLAHKLNNKINFEGWIELEILPLILIEQKY